ncbi:hypothetical protein [Citrobacter braakii]|uniref:hypothetical protein n=1 Tax=Citrobacter braakii TaxID=57706 RepID=UPI00403A4931
MATTRTFLPPCDSQFPPEQFWDLFTFITQNGHSTGSMETPMVVLQADEEIALFYKGIPDYHSVWLKQGIPVAAGDNLAAIFWCL